ncbi:MAG: peptidylprolyl isomerase [Hyphomicrobiaceae bacterium]
MNKIWGAICALSLLLATGATVQADENTVRMTLKGGEVIIQLRPDIAPKHVARVKELISKGFYNGIVFHRVIPNFMAQTGDPSGTGRGGSKLPDLKAEFSKTAKFKKGTIGAARTNDPNSANSQFFICHTNKSCAHLNGQYTIWGQVTKGMEHIAAVKGPTDKIVKMEMVQ